MEWWYGELGLEDYHVMARGLGKNSPIKIRLNRQNYHALIARHGQPVRWMKARPCTCVMANNRPDPNCSTCAGDGWRYDYPRSVIETDYARVTAKNVITLPKEHNPVSVEAVWDTSNAGYDVKSFSGRKITISGKRTPENYESLKVSFTHSFEREADYSGVYQGSGVIDVPSLYTRTLHGTYAKFITGVVSGVTPTSFVDARIHFTPPDPEPAKNTKYRLRLKVSDPHTFVILGQSIRRVDQQWLQAMGGDALAVVPASIDVGPNDVMTPLIAEVVDRTNLTKRNGVLDTLPAYYVKRVPRIDTQSAVYAEGTDYVMWGRNQVRWITTPPASGTTLSVEYVYCPTYRVLQEQPNTRSSEGQLFPKRVALKLMTGRSRRDGL